MEFSDVFRKDVTAAVPEFGEFSIDSSSPRGLLQSAKNTNHVEKEGFTAEWRVQPEVEPLSMLNESIDRFYPAGGHCEKKGDMRSLGSLPAQLVSYGQASFDPTDLVYRVEGVLKGRESGMETAVEVPHLDNRPWGPWVVAEEVHRKLGIQEDRMNRMDQRDRMAGAAARNRGS